MKGIHKLAFQIADLTLALAGELAHALADKAPTGLTSSPSLVTVEWVVRAEHSVGDATSSIPGRIRFGLRPGEDGAVEPVGDATVALDTSDSKYPAPGRSLRLSSTLCSSAEFLDLLDRFRAQAKLSPWRETFGHLVVAACAARPSTR